jgi:hypothetical protein
MDYCGNITKATKVITATAQAKAITSAIMLLPGWPRGRVAGLFVYILAGLFLYSMCFCSSQPIDILGLATMQSQKRQNLYLAFLARPVAVVNAA